MARRRTLAALAAAGLVALAAWADDPPVPGPDVKAGDSWTYRQTRTGERAPAEPVVYEIKVTFVGPKAIKAVSTLPGGKEIDTTWTPEWNVVTDGRSGSFFPDSGLLRFPLKPGLRYNTQYELVRPRRDSFDSKNTLNVRIAGWEELSVPAGTFRALKVEANGTFERADKARDAIGELHYVVWYVPELKRWAKLSFRSTSRRGGPGMRQEEELLSYRVQ